MSYSSHRETEKTVTRRNSSEQSPIGKMTKHKMAAFLFSASAGAQDSEKIILLRLQLNRGVSPGKG